MPMKQRMVYEHALLKSSERRLDAIKRQKRMFLRNVENIIDLRPNDVRPRRPTSDIVKRKTVRYGNIRSTASKTEKMESRLSLPME